MMKMFAPLLLSAALAIGCAHQPGTMTLSVDFSPKNDVSVVSYTDIYEVKHTDTVREGKVVLQIPCGDYPHLLQLELKRPKGSGMKKVIVEPGRYTLVYNARGRLTVQGSNYNDAVFNSWQESPELAAAEVEFERFKKENGQEYRGSGASEERKMYLRAVYDTLQGNLWGMKYEILLRNMRQEDPHLQALTIQEMEVRRQNIGYVDAVVAALPEVPYVQAFAERAERVRDRIRREDRVAVGQPYMEVTAQDKAGKTVTLSELLSQNDLVLLYLYKTSGAHDKYLPYLEKVYRDFHRKGLAVVSLSFDREADWLKELKATGHPWLQLNDRQGSDSPILSDYATTAASQVILISKDGIIRDKGMHRLRLHDVVGELLH